jgi:hypothetical protein
MLEYQLRTLSEYVYLSIRFYGALKLASKFVNELRLFFPIFQVKLKWYLLGSLLEHFNLSIRFYRALKLASKVCNRNLSIFPIFLGFLRVS